MTKKRTGNTASRRSTARRRERRSRLVPGGPLTSASLLTLLRTQTPASGEDVNEITALNLSAVWAAVNLLTRSLAVLPLLVYRRLGGRARERDDSHPVYRLLHRGPNADMTNFIFRQTMQANVLLWGNGYAVIERNGLGEPLALVPCHPTNVTVRRDTVTGQLVYTVIDSDGRPHDYQSGDMLHIRALTTDGLVGRSILSVAAETLGEALAAGKFAARYFANGARPSGFLVPPKPLREAERKVAERELQEWYGGENAHRIAVVQPGTQWVPLTMPLEDAQFLQTRKYSVTEIARWFGVPPHMLGDLDRATFSNIEQQGLEFVTYSLLPWLVNWEQELNRKLFSMAERDVYFVEHVVDGLLRADLTTRYNAYAVAISHGFRCPDEVRALENENPIPDGSGKIFTRPVNVAPIAARPQKGGDDEQAK